MSITTSSAWFDVSASANKLRQSYLKGFLDISGGGVYVRADNSLNFYTAASATVPKFSMNAEKITVVSDVSNVGKDGTDITFSTKKLGYLWDLSENIQQVFKDIRKVINGETTSAATSTTELAVVTDAKIGGNLQVGGNVYIDQNLAVSGNVSIGQNLSVKGNALFGGNVEVAGNQVINMNLYVKGDSFLSGRLFVTGDCSFHNNIGIYGNTTTVGHVIAGGDLSATGIFSLTGAATMKSTLSVAAATTMASTLGVTLATTLASTLSVGSSVVLNSTLSVGADATLNAKLSVGGTSVLNSTLSVGSGAVLNSTLSVGAATTMASTLSVGGNATFAENLSMQTGKEFKLGNVKITSASTGNDPNLIETLSGNLTITPALKVHITKDLVVDGSFTFGGTLTQSNVDIKITEQLDICANGVTPLNVHQEGGDAFDIADFTNTAGTVFIVGKNNTVAINRAVATSGFNFDVSGKSLFSGDVSMSSILQVAGATKLMSTLAVTSATTLSDTLAVTNATTLSSSLSVGTTTTLTGAATLSSTLAVTGESTFTAKATFNSNIVFAANKYIDQSADGW